MGGLKRGRPLLGCRPRGRRGPCHFQPLLDRSVIFLFIIDPWIVTIHDFIGVVSCLSEVLGFDIADMEKSIPTDTEVDEGRLNARFEIDDLAFVDVSDVVVLTGSLGVELFKNSIFEDGDPTFFGLRDIDEHFPSSFFL